MSVFVISLGKKLSVKIELDIRSFENLEFISEFVDDILDSFFAWVSYPDMHEFLVWGIGELFPLRECVYEKISIISLGDIFDEF